jgi:transcriptional regulator with XRE-family HTH domain
MGKVKNKNIESILDQLTSKEVSKWHERSDFRIRNESWIRRSQAISLTILRTLRKQNKTQKELAERLDLSPQQINKWVKGNENFTIESLVKIEKALGIKILYESYNYTFIVKVGEKTCSSEKLDSPTKIIGMNYCNNTDNYNMMA